MTVGDVLDSLAAFDRSLTVYVPGVDGIAQIVACVGPLEHVGLPPGIRIPHDVFIMSQEFADSLDASDDTQEDNT